MYAFSPDSGAGKEALHVLSLYFDIPVLVLLTLAGLNLIEHDWKSRQHWKRVAHQPDTSFLLGEEVTTLFKGEHAGPLLLAAILNAMMSILAVYVIQVTLKFFA